MTTAQPRPLFTPKALATYLGLSERTVWQMLADGVIPSVKVNAGRAGARRIDPADVDEYLSRRRREDAQ